MECEYHNQNYKDCFVTQNANSEEHKHETECTQTQLDSYDDKERYFELGKELASQGKTWIFYAGELIFPTQQDAKYFLRGAFYGAFTTHVFCIMKCIAAHYAGVLRGADCHNHYKITSDSDEHFNDETSHSLCDKEYETKIQDKQIEDLYKEIRTILGRLFMKKCNFSDGNEISLQEFGKTEDLIFWFSKYLPSYLMQAHHFLCWKYGGIKVLAGDDKENKSLYKILQQPAKRYSEYRTFLHSHSCEFCAMKTFACRTRKVRQTEYMRMTKASKEAFDRHMEDKEIVLQAVNSFCSNGCLSEEMADKLFEQRE